MALLVTVIYKKSYLTLPYLTKFNIPCRNPAGGSLILVLPEATLSYSQPRYWLPDFKFRKLLKHGEKYLGTAKVE